MAEQIGAMYVTIDGVDKISPKLKQLETELTKVNKATGDITIGNNKNFEYVRQQFADLSKYYARLQDQMNSRVALKLDTSDIEREMGTVMNAVRKLYDMISTPVNGTNFLNRSFESVKGDAESGAKAVIGVKDEIDNLTKTVLGSAKAAASLQQEIDRLGTKNGKALTANSAKEEANLVSKNRLIEGLTVAYNRLGYAMQDVGRKMSGAQGNDFLMNSGNNLLKRIEMYRDAIGVALEGANKGVYKRSDAIQLLGSSYIDLYDKRGQFGKSVGMYQKEKERQVREEERLNKEVTAAVNARYDAESARRRQNAEEIKREALQYEALRKAAADAAARTANANRIGATPISASESAFSASIQAQMNARVKAEEANQRNHERQMRLQYKQNQDYTRLVANGKNELNRLYRLRAETHERMGDMMKRGVDTTELKNLMQRIQEAIKEYKRVLNNVSKGEAVSILKGGTMRGEINTLMNNAGSLFRKDNRAKQIEEANIAQQKFLSGMDGISTKTSWLGEQFQMLKGYIVSAFAVDQLRNFMNGIIQTGGQLENQRIAIGSILDNKSQANDLFERIKQMAVKSPFGVLQLDQYTKSLTAYGYEYNELYDMLKRLADISAGAGVDMNRLTLAIGHVKAETALTGITLRQFTMANIPMLEMLSKMYSDLEKRSVTVADVRKRISGKQVSYDDVMSVIKMMTDEGGRFFDMQNVLSDTLKTKWKNLGDQIDIVYGEMAEGAPGDALKSLADTLMVIARNWRSIGEAATMAGVAMLAVKAKGFFNGAYIGSKSAGIMSQIRSQDALYKNNLRLASTYRRLNSEEARALASGDRLSVATLKLAATEGRLNKEMVLRLVAQKELAVSQGAVLMRTLGITQGELMMAAAADKATVSTTLLGNAMRTAGNALKAFWASWGPAIGMFAVFEGIFYLYEKVHKLSENSEKLTDGAKENITKLSEMIASIQNKPTDNTQLQNGIDEMMKTVKDYGLEVEWLYDYIFNGKKASGTNTAINDLSTQYDRLRMSLDELKKTQDYVAEHGNIFSNADEDTGGWLGMNDTFGENMKDASDAFRNMSKEIQKADLSEWVIELAKIREQYGAFAADVAKQGIASNIEKQIKLLYSPKYLEYIAARNAFLSGHVSANTFGGHDYVIALDRMKDDAKDFAENVKESMKNAFPNGVDYDNLTAAQRIFLDNQYKNWVGTFGDISEDVQKELKKILKDYHITISASYEFPEKPTAAWVQQQLGYVSGSSAAESIVKGAKNYPELVESAKTRYKKLVEENKSFVQKLNKAGKKVSGKQKLTALGVDSAAMRDYIDGYNATVDEILSLENLAKQNGFDISEKIKKPKKTGNQRDKELQDWQKRIQAIEKFIELYKKYRELYGSEEAKNRIKSDTEKLGISKYDFGNPAAVREQMMKEMEALYGKRKTQEREAARDTAVEKYKEEILKKEEENIRLRMKAYEEEAKAETERWNRFQEMRKAGLSDSIASSLTLQLSKDQEDKYFKWVEVAKKAFVDEGSLTDSKEQIAQMYNQKELLDSELKEKQKRLKTETLTHKEQKHLNEEIRRLIAEIGVLTQEITDAELDTLGTGVHGLDAVQATGKARYKELTMNREEILRQMLETAIKNSGKDYTVEKLMEDYRKNPEGVKDNLGGENGNDYEVYLTLKAYIDYLREAERKRDAAIKQAVEMVKDFGYVVKKLDNQNKARKEDLGGQVDESTGIPGITYGDLYDADNALKKMKAGLEYFRLMEIPLTLAEEEAKKLAKTLKDDLDKALKAHVISEKEYADELKKIDDKLLKVRNPKTRGRYEVMQNLGDYKTFVESRRNRLLQEAQDLDTQGKPEEAQKKRDEAFNLGIRLKNMKDFEGIIGGMSKAFKALEDVTKPVVTLFDALGEEGISQYFDVIGNALGTASSVNQGLNALGIDAGPWGAGIAAALSVTESIIRMHDAALQKEIEASKARAQHDEWYMSNLRTIATEQMGGMYGKNGNKDIMSMMNAMYGGRGALIDKKTRSQIDKANKSGELYDAMMASAMAKRDEAKRQLYNESAKKKKDDDAIRGYEEQLAEAEKEVKELSQTIAKELYGIDFKEWANNFGEALASAWEQGKSGLKAYKDAVTDVLKQTLVSVMQQKVMQVALEPLMEEFMSQFDSDGGKMTEASWAILEKMYQLGEDTAEETYAMLDGLEQVAQQHGSTMKRGGGGLSSAVAGVTEDTADLLASYINGIRADVSVQRGYMAGIASDVAYIASMMGAVDYSPAKQDYTVDNSALLTRMAEEQMPIVANTLASQLAELKRIEMNTARGADAAEALEAMIGSAVNGVRPINVRMQ